MLKAEEYTHIKGYEWLVLNHERYRDCLKEHYSYLLCECCGFPSPAAACSFLNSVVSRASTLFDEATVDFCLDESLPLKVALLPADLLCVAVTVAYQLQTLPSSVVFGMQFMSDAHPRPRDRGPGRLHAVLLRHSRVRASPAAAGPP